MLSSKLQTMMYQSNTDDNPFVFSEIHTIEGGTKMLYKFISETEIEQAPPYIREQGIVTSNPPEEKLRALGYKDLIIEPCPETAEGCYRLPIYMDGDVIIQKWSEEIKDGENN